MPTIRRSVLAACLLAAGSLAFAPRPAGAASAAEIDSKVDLALQNLYDSTPAAKALADAAKGILIFPDVIKGGLIVGGLYGAGALRENGRSVGYYNTVAASIGLQAGAQSFSYALFFMSADALDYLHKSDGWEIGVGPTVVVVDTGLAAKLSTTTAKSDVYAFIYGQKGLMAGLGIEGSKITEITPDK
jgi:lipid-binding SYLF domain-containing protein